MKCKNCGNPLTGEENFCRICGTPVEKNTDSDIENKDLELSGNIDVTKIVVEKEKKDKEKLEKKEDSEKPVNKLESRPDEPEKNESDNDFLLIEEDSEKRIKKILDEFDKEDNIKEKEEKEDKPSKTETNQKEANKKNTNNEKEDKVEKNKDNKDESSGNNNEKKEEIIDKDSKEESKETDTEKEASKPEEETVNQESNESLENNNNVANLIADQERKQSNDNDNSNELVSEPALEITPTEVNEVDNIDFNVEPVAEYIPAELTVDTNKKTKSNKGIITFLIIIIFIVSVVCGYFFIQYTKTKSDNDSLVKDNKTLEDALATEKNKKEENNEFNYIFKYNGYEIATNNNDKIIIENNLVQFNEYIISIGKGTNFNNFKQALEERKNTLTKNKYIVNNYGKKVFENKEYIFFDCKNEKGEKYLIIYTGISENDTIVFLNSYDKNEPDFTIVENYYKFISTLKKSDNTPIYENGLFE